MNTKVSTVVDWSFFDMEEPAKILNDVRNGKKLPWKEKKAENLTYAQYLSILGFKKANNVAGCGELLEFAVTDAGLKLYRTWFCKSRLCPLCAWRRRLKNVGETVAILDEANTRVPKSEFLFLTLTLKNAELGELKKVISDLHKGFNRLFRYKKIDGLIRGYIRSTEITINRSRRQFHPHIHVVLMVPRGYSKHTELKRYITHSEWVALWRRALKIDYDPGVYIEKAKARKRKNGKLEKSELAAVKEIAKYQVKSGDYITGNVVADLVYVEELELALRHTRQFGYGGIFKEVRKELLLDDEEEDLINYGNGNEEVDHEDDVEVDDIPDKTVMYKWVYAMSNYVKFEC